MSNILDELERLENAEQVKKEIYRMRTGREKKVRKDTIITKKMATKICLVFTNTIMSGIIFQRTQGIRRVTQKKIVITNVMTKLMNAKLKIRITSVGTRRKT